PGRGFDEWCDPDPDVDAALSELGLATPESPVIRKSDGGVEGVDVAAAVVRLTSRRRVRHLVSPDHVPAQKVDDVEAEFGCDPVEEEVARRRGGGGADGAVGPDRAAISEDRDDAPFIVLEPVDRGKVPC